MNSLCGTSAAFRRILSSVFPKLPTIWLCLATVSSVMLPPASPRESNMEKIIHINKAANTFLNLIFSEIILFLNLWILYWETHWQYLPLWFYRVLLPYWPSGSRYNASLSGNHHSMPQLNKNYQFFQKYIMNVYVYSTNITDQTC